MNNHNERGELSEWKGDRDPLTQRVIACAIDVHRTLGPGSWNLPAADLYEVGSSTSGTAD